MSKFSDDPMINKIRNLLKKAESLSKMTDENSKHEAEACNEKAAELIVKHGIDQALLAEAGKIEDPIVSKRIEILDNYARDRHGLLSQIVNAFGAKAVVHSNHKYGTVQGKTYTFHVFAHESDMNRIEFVYELLQPQMIFGAMAAPVPYYDTARSFRKSWMTGFSAAIYNRLKRHEKQVVAESESSTGTALVLVNRSGAVEKAYQTAYPKLGTVKPRKLRGSGRSQGYAAGQRASLGDNELGDNSRRALASN